ncbi:MAG: hypothetical protein WCB49_10100 [Gammaproteobacteria bacterium]
MRGTARLGTQYALAALGLMLVLPAGALASPPKPVADALALLNSGMDQLAGGWQYQQKVTSDQGSETLAYDGSRPVGERWTVLAVNGKPPSAKQAKELAEKARAEHKKGKSSDNVSLGMDSWLQASHYRLIHADDKQFVYQIEVQAGAHDSASADAMLKHLAGQFVVARDDHRPLKLTLDNFESFSPRFGVKVTQFHLQIQFRRLSAPAAPVVADRVSTEAKGKVFWIKSFDTKTRVILSHFVPVSGTVSTPVPASR